MKLSPRLGSVKSRGRFKVRPGLNYDEGAVLRMSLKLCTFWNMFSTGEFSSLANFASISSSPFSVMVELSMTEHLESVSVNGFS